MKISKKILLSLLLSVMVINPVFSAAAAEGSGSSESEWKLLDYLKVGVAVAASGVTALKVYQYYSNRSEKKNMKKEMKESALNDSFKIYKDVKKLGEYMENYSLVQKFCRENCSDISENEIDQMIKALDYSFILRLVKYIKHEDGPIFSAVVAKDIDVIRWLILNKLVDLNDAGPKGTTRIPLLCFIVNITCDLEIDQKSYDEYKELVDVLCDLGVKFEFIFQGKPSHILHYQMPSDIRDIFIKYMIQDIQRDDLNMKKGTEAFFNGCAVEDRLDKLHKDGSNEYRKYLRNYRRHSVRDFMFAERIFYDKKDAMLLLLENFIKKEEDFDIDTGCYKSEHGEELSSIIKYPCRLLEAEKYIKDIGNSDLSACSWVWGGQSHEDSVKKAFIEPVSDFLLAQEQKLLLDSFAI